MLKTFIEIGTCDFDTNLPLIASGEWRGVMCEPVQKFYSSLFEKSLKIPHRCNLAIENVAVSDRDGSVEMAVANEHSEEWTRGISHVVSENHLGAMLSKEPLNIEKGRFEEQKTIVPCYTLDTLIKIHRMDFIDFLKIDTEGHELTILENYSWKIKPKFIKCEHKHTDDIRMKKILESHGYIVNVELDDIYAIR